MEIPLKDMCSSTCIPLKDVFIERFMTELYLVKFVQIYNGLKIRMQWLCDYNVCTIYSVQFNVIRLIHDYIVTQYSI